jgi:hypothetical protein
VVGFVVSRPFRKGREKDGKPGHISDRLKGRISPCGKTHALSRTLKALGKASLCPEMTRGFCILFGLFLSPVLNSPARF